MGLLSDKEAASLAPATEADSPTPVPIQVVSSDEFPPIPQTSRQKQVEARRNEVGGEYAGRNGLSRRRFIQTVADRFAGLRSEYERQGRDPSHRRYGFVAPT